ncbi:MAG: UDP-4-amino-4,6-dideoxy-N-acetyl-beta-L-altrosamine transaminase [Alphaproteobacteria bacterium]|nr:UDP-4-amino-4,6-dideoxy-N-acetyl-beta-L-altrosamine transaminase [Alphaproteobacteria bacterium]
MTHSGGDRFLPYARQDLDASDIAAVVDVLNSDWLTQGPKVPEFERAIARRVGSNFAVAMSSGTAALHAACMAAGLGPEDEIITSPITFAASGNCALYAGANVRFADIRQDTYCIDPQRISDALTPKTKAIVPVDFTGQPCDLDEISGIARRNGLVVIEDAAHALGSTYRDRCVGSLADMTVFSFHPVKHVAAGEGGLVATNDSTFDASLRLFRSHGISNAESSMTLPDQAADNEGLPPEHANPPGMAGWYYEMLTLGYNYRITDMQCALGLSQLARLDSFIERRRRIAQRYTEAFSQSQFLSVPTQLSDRQSAWHLYVLSLRLKKMEKTRRRVFDELRAMGIGVHVHYIPLHLQPYYRKRFGYKRGDFPVAEAYYDSALTIPLFPAMSDIDVERVIKSVLQVVQ